MEGMGGVAGQGRGGGFFRGLLPPPVGIAEFKRAYNEGAARDRGSFAMCADLTTWGCPRVAEARS